MEHLHISQGTIHFGKEPLGDSKIILADPGEFRGIDEIKHLQLPERMDIVFAVGDRVAAGEIKYPADLVTSHQKRRLQRQLRNIRAMADIGILFLRDWEQECIVAEQVFARQRNARYRPQSLWQDLAGFQTQGGYVLHLPADDEEAVEFIRWYQQGLATSGVRMFAGTDVKESKRGGTILRKIDGIGRMKERQLLARYTTPMGAFLAATQSPQLVKEHFGPGMVKRLRDAVMYMEKT